MDIMIAASFIKSTGVTYGQVIRRWDRIIVPWLFTFCRAKVMGVRL